MIFRSGPTCRAISLALLGSWYLNGVLAQKAPVPAPRTKEASPPVVARLAYDWKPGSVFRYRITGLFQGNFPPFAQPGSPPANLKAVLEYVGTVKKVDEKGAEVSFEVDRADLSLLEKEPGPDGKIDPDSEIPFPIPTSQAQKTLNVTAIIRPDGSVVSVTNNDTTPIRADLGIDLRKLFLLILPVTFPDRPVKLNEEWQHADGVLGQKEGRVSYRNRLVEVTPEGKRLLLAIQHDAESQIADRKDKEGRLIEDAANAVETVEGKAVVTGKMFFTVTSRALPKQEALSGMVQKGQLQLTARLKRTAPDPEKPEEKQTADIAVKARLSVQAMAPARQPGASNAAPSSPEKDR
ncbi:MAG: hypothetical protein RMJ43_00970 [Chloroherpetonaceae bacterium]|nr:hypothetical protein [Chthonomonadaceae bacterium]MDW8206380.1 hypothetical protein [Chloroherpetonaceae bacterium]